MADHKQFKEMTPADEELLKLLEKTRNITVAEDQLREQRISFAFGNAPHSAEITRDSVVRASQSMRLRG